MDTSLSPEKNRDYSPTFFQLTARSVLRKEPLRFAKSYTEFE